MANLTTLFWVRASQVNKKGLAPLMIRVTIPVNDVSDFSSGNFVDPKLWNPDKKQVSGRSEEAERINKYITNSAAKLQKIYDDLEREERPISSELVKNIFLGKNQIKVTVISAIDDHNKAFEKRIEAEKNSKKKKPVSESTLDKFELLKVKLVDFMDFKYQRKDMFISEVNYGFIEDFRTWLLERGHHKLGGLSADSATGHLKKFNKITLALFKRGVLKTDPFIDTELRWEDPTAEGISEDQLLALEKLDLQLPRLQKVLDRFIVGCYSGMAHSDISKITRDDIMKNFGDDGNWLRLRRTKTGEICKVPILPPVQAIIDKYDNDPRCIKENKLFPVVGLNSCNDYLKEIAVFAKIQFHLTTHVARHTFAQMAMDLGVNIEAIAEILGHATSKTTKTTYARASHKFVAAEIDNFKNKKFPHLKIVEVNQNVG